MGSLKDWVVQKLIMSWLKGFLEKLPFNGMKTVLGVVVAALGALMRLAGAGHPVFDYAQMALEFLNTLNIPVITDPSILAMITGGVYALWGAAHKLIKRKEAKDSGLPPANTKFSV
jgi:hypothetical protein